MSKEPYYDKEIDRILHDNELGTPYDRWHFMYMLGYTRNREAAREFMRRLREEYPDSADQIVADGLHNLNDHGAAVVGDLLGVKKS